MQNLNIVILVIFFMEVISFMFVMHFNDKKIVVYLNFDQRIFPKKGEIPYFENYEL